MTSLLRLGRVDEAIHMTLEMPAMIEDWRRDYNEVRPNSSLKEATPKEYAEITAGL